MCSSLLELPNKDVCSTENVPVLIGFHYHTVEYAHEQLVLLLQLKF